MTEWDYGGVWRRVDMGGEIQLPHDSVVQVWDWWRQGLPDFMREADTIFVDPPWNTGNIKSFYTKADLPHLQIDFVQFSKELMKRIDTIAPRFLFIEMGKEHLGWFIERCRERYRHVTFYNSTYYGRAQNKCYVIHATDDWRARRYPELEDLDEEKIIAWLGCHHDYGCVGDLCMGRGLVGWHAYKNGRRFVGTELNRKRLAVLVDKIRKEEQRKC